MVVALEFGATGAAPLLFRMFSSGRQTSEVRHRRRGGLAAPRLRGRDAPAVVAAGCISLRAVDELCSRAVQASQQFRSSLLLSPEPL